MKVLTEWMWPSFIVVYSFGHSTVENAWDGCDTGFCVKEVLTLWDADIDTDVQFEISTVKTDGHKIWLNYNGRVDYSLTKAGDYAQLFRGTSWFLINKLKLKPGKTPVWVNMYERPHEYPITINTAAV